MITHEGISGRGEPVLYRLTLGTLRLFFRDLFGRGTVGCGSMRYPTAQYPSHPNSHLGRNSSKPVINYFAKKYQTKYDLEEAVLFVTSP